MSQGRKKSSPGLRKIEPWKHEEGQEFAGSDLAEHVGSISGISQADAGKPCCWGHVYHVRVQLASEPTQESGSFSGQQPG